MVSIQTILHPTDLSEAAQHAFHLACALARDYKARLLVMNIAPPPLEEGLRPEEYTERLWHDLRQLRDPADQVDVEHLLREGDPATEIPRAAQELKCDLIVMGTHGWVRGERLLIGSVAQEVFSRAPCLVSIVRSPFPTPLSATDTTVHELAQQV